MHHLKPSNIITSKSNKSTVFACEYIKLNPIKIVIGDDEILSD